MPALSHPQLKLEKGVGGSMLPAGKSFLTVWPDTEKGGAAVKGSSKVARFKDSSSIAMYLSKEAQVL